MSKNPLGGLLCSLVLFWWGVHSSLREPLAGWGRGDTQTRKWPSHRNQPRLHQEDKEIHVWNWGLIRAIFPDTGGMPLYSGPQGAAETCRYLWTPVRGRSGSREPRREGGNIGRGERVKKEPGWPVCQSVCLLTGHRPLFPQEATLDRQVKPLDQLNHRIYSNCIVIVPKEPGSNELDIIKILMPSFHS